ncbi:MAG: HAMP domain-containing protein [Deferribacteraceae bacterium]|jgi:hypothetical protein|nr:HAMP domain-containing protein [Deferribacteraceae bacterium]
MHKLSGIPRLVENAKVILIVLYTFCFIAGGVMYYTLYAGFMYESGVERISGDMAVVVAGKEELFYHYSLDKDNVTIKQELQNLFSELFASFPDGDLALVDENFDIVVNRGYWGKASIDYMLRDDGMFAKTGSISTSMVVKLNKDLVGFVHPYLKDGDMKVALVYVVERGRILKNVFDFGITLALLTFIVMYMLGLALIAVLVGFVMSPLKRILEGIEKLATSNFNYRVPKVANDELGLLTRSYNSLSAQLYELSQKTVAEQSVRYETEEEVQKYNLYLENLIMRRAGEHDIEREELNSQIVDKKRDIDALHSALYTNHMTAAAAFLAQIYAKRLGMLVYNISDVAGNIARGGVGVSEFKIGKNVEQFNADAINFVNISSNVRYMLEDNFDIFTFDTDDFCRKLSELLSYIPTGVNVVVEADDVGERDFTGYEQFYMRTLLFLSAYVANLLAEQDVAGASLFVKVSVLGKRLRVVMQDNRLPSGTDIADIRMGEVEQGIIYCAQLLLERYRCSIIAKPASVGMRYTIEFSGALI